MTMTNIDSPVWNPVRERLLEALAQHIDGKRPPIISQKLERSHFAGTAGTDTQEVDAIQRCIYTTAFSVSLSPAPRKTSGLLRGLLSATLVGGAFPSAHHRNAYVPQERGMPPRHGGHGLGGIDDDDEEAEQVSNELEQVRLLLHLPKNNKGAIHI